MAELNARLVQQIAANINGVTARSISDIKYSGIVYDGVNVYPPIRGKNMEALHYIISAKLRPKYALPLSHVLSVQGVLEYVKAYSAALHKMRGISNEIIALLVWSR